MALDPDGPRQVVAAIAARLRAGVPALTAVEHHPGILSVEAVAQAAKRAPRAYLSVTDIDIIGRGRGIGAPAWTLRLGLGLSLLTRDTVTDGALQLPRQDQAVNLIGALALVVATAGWGDPALGRAEVVKARNVYDQAQGAGGVQIWSLTWSQTWTVAGEGLDGATPPRVWLGRAPDIGPPHIDDYDPMAPGDPLEDRA